MKIVCGTDFSEQAFRASEAAARLARRFGDSLVLVHAMEMPSVLPHLTPTDVAGLRKQVLTTAQSRLHDVATLLRRRGIDVEERVLEGAPASLLLDVGREVDARLIAIGTHGRHAPAKWFVGSVAEGVVSRSDRPVLVVRDGPTGLESFDPAAPFRVLVALDSSRASDAALEVLSRFRLAAGCDATLMNVYWPPEEYERLGLTGPRDVVGRDQDVVRVLERELRPKVATVLGAGAVTLRIEPSVGAIPEVLAAAGEAGGYELLIAGTHQWHGMDRLRHGSPSLGLIHVAHLPVLLVPERTVPATATLPAFHRILVATDFSDIGNAAVPYAYAMLDAKGGEVDLCYVHVREMADPIYAYEPRGAPLSDERRAALARDLSALVPESASKLGVTSRVHVVEAARAPEGIIQAAERLGVDAVCVGSHGRAGLRAAALGSVAAAVIHRSRKPVLVVRLPAG